MQAHRRYNGSASFAKGEQGVVLLESLIAILIFSLGILGIVGLQATMIKNTSDAKYRSDASYIAQQRIGELWANPEALPAADSDAQTTDISAVLPGGTLTLTPNPAVEGQFTVTVSWLQPGTDAQPHTFTTIASVNGG